MSVSIELPCGCKINEAFVLGICMEHALELDARKREAHQAYREFELKMQSTDTSSMPQEPK